MVGKCTRIVKGCYLKTAANRMICGGQTGIYLEDQRIEFEALINIRPRLGNRSVLIQSEDIRRSVEEISRRILGGVQ